jgi:ribosomal protein L37AE/L43A
MDMGYDRLDGLAREYAFVEYTGEACLNCGRHRVERLASGKRICEKCAWDQDTDEYSGEYREIHG